MRALYPFTQECHLFVITKGANVPPEKSYNVNYMRICAQAIDAVILTYLDRVEKNSAQVKVTEERVYLSCSSGVAATFGFGTSSWQRAVQRLNRMGLVHILPGPRRNGFFVSSDKDAMQLRIAALKQ